jgi:hypothetical protein
MAPTAAYDEIADCYEQEFLPRTAAAGADPVGAGADRKSQLSRRTVRPCARSTSSARPEQAAADTHDEYRSAVIWSTPGHRRVITIDPANRARSPGMRSVASAPA